MSGKMSLKFREPSMAGSVQSIILVIFLTIVLLGTIATAYYFITMPKEGEAFTEFYVLGPGGEASGYPAEISVGEEASVILGIVNHEQEKTSYLVEIVIDGVNHSEKGPLNLENNTKWESQVTFQVDKPGNDQRIEFFLFKDGHIDIYRSLHLWVDVK